MTWGLAWLHTIDSPLTTVIIETPNRWWQRQESFSKQVQLPLSPAERQLWHRCFIPAAPLKEPIMYSPASKFSRYRAHRRACAARTSDTAWSREDTWLPSIDVSILSFPTSLMKAWTSFPLNGMISWAILARIMIDWWLSCWKPGLLEARVTTNIQTMVHVKVGVRFGVMVGERVGVRLTAEVFIVARAYLVFNQGTIQRARRYRFQ